MYNIGRKLVILAQTNLLNLGGWRYGPGRSGKANRHSSLGPNYVRANQVLGASATRSSGGAGNGAYANDSGFPQGVPVAGFKLFINNDLCE